MLQFSELHTETAPSSHQRFPGKQSTSLEDRHASGMRFFLLPQELLHFKQMILESNRTTEAPPWTLKEQVLLSVFGKKMALRTSDGHPSKVGLQESFMLKGNLKAIHCRK